MADEPRNEDAIAGDDAGREQRGDSGGISDDWVFAGAPGDSPVVDPGEYTPRRDADGRSLNKDGTPRKRRGTGSSGKGKTETRLEIGSIEALLLTVHSGLAMVTRIEEFELAPDEATKLAEATVRLQKHYPFLSASGKTVDHINFFTALAGVYGSRFAAYNMRKKAEHEEAKAKSRQEAPNVIDLSAQQFTG